jgi:hypothetical protein
MSDLLLQTIVEKLDAFEIALLKRDDNGIKNEVRQLIANETKPFQFEIKQCATNLENLNATLNVLVGKQDEISTIVGARRDHIVHQHHLHKGLWISLALFFLVIVLILTSTNLRSSLAIYEANDIKYRLLKVKADTALLKMLYKTDSLYVVDADAFRDHTLQEEERLAERARLFRLAGEKEKEAKQLFRKAKAK